MTKQDTGKLEHYSLNDNSYLQTIPTTVMYRTFSYNSVEFISICFFIEHIQQLHDFLLFKAMNTICQLDGNFDY